MTLPSGISQSHFSGIPLTQFGRSVTRTPIIKTVDNQTGREILTSGTPVTITAVAFKWAHKLNQANVMKVESADAYIMVASDVTLNDQDLITFDSETYECIDVETIYVAGTAMFKYANLLLRS